MKDNKKSKLPRGLRWKSDSPYIWFSWRDSRGKQHQESTQTNDPAKALAFKLQFMEKLHQGIEESNAQASDMGKLPLKRVAELYFDWKAANNTASTIARERRIFKRVERFFAPDFPVKSIRLPHIRQYQQERRKQISPTMKQPVTARTVNYE